jgi:hypothetical protein
VHYNHLRINAVASHDAQIEYRDLTKPYVPTEYVAPAQTSAVTGMASTGLQADPVPAHSCGERFEFKAGMLRENIIDALRRCGYNMGEWSLGTREFMVDIPIRSAFSIDIESGLEDVLQTVAQVYGIRGEIDPITNSVHFSRAIIGESE